MKLALVVILALVSFVVTASPCDPGDFEQLTVQFPAEREQASEHVVLEGVIGDWSDAQLTASSCTCAGREYSTGYVNSSIAAAYRINPQPKRGREYPHIFNNHEGLPFECNQKPLVEFPILRTGIYRPGRDRPGADRVVYAVTTRRGKPQAQYCGCMTHEGAPRRNGFIMCD